MNKLYTAIIILFFNGFCLNSRCDTKIIVKKEGTLRSLINNEQFDTITSLSIVGRLNSEDIKLLRQMAGYKETINDRTGRLNTLNLSEAVLCKDKRPYMVLDTSKEPIMLYATARDIPSDMGTKWTLPSHKYSSGSKTTYIKNSPAIYDIKYILGMKINDSIPTVKKYHDGVVIVLRKGMSKKERRTLSSHNAIKVRGHRLKYENNRYLYYAYLHHNEYCNDMFYGCPMLQVIRLPEHIEISEIVNTY